MVLSLYEDSLMQGKTNKMNSITIDFISSSMIFLTNKNIKIQAHIEQWGKQNESETAWKP